MALVQAFAAEVAKLPPDVQQRRIAKVLAAMPDEEKAILDLKLPHSVDQLWRTGRGRIYRSSTYDVWRKEAGWELQAQRPGKVEGEVEVSIALGRPDNRKRDLDNAAGKAVLDLLVSHQVIECDSKVMRITSSWDRSVPAGRVIVIVNPALADVP